MRLHLCDDFCASAGSSPNFFGFLADTTKAWTASFFVKRYHGATAHFSVCRFTLQTLLVTLTHPLQRLPPKKLGGILAEIYNPHLDASETC